MSLRTSASSPSPTPANSYSEGVVRDPVESERRGLEFVTRKITGTPRSR
jgi:hypothetical protein